MLWFVAAVQIVVGVAAMASAKSVMHEILAAVMWTGGMIVIAISVAAGRLEAAAAKIVPAVSVPTVSAARTMSTKSCPECAEEVNERAKICPHCRHAFDVVNASDSGSDNDAVVSTRTYLGLYYAVLADGRIRVTVKEGTYTFQSVEAFRADLAQRPDWWKRQAGKDLPI